jgi:hypothetical protein
MEEIAWAAAAAVVALVPPVRRRFLPVSKALLSAGLGIGTAALRGVEGVIVAAACGEQPAGGKTNDKTAAADGRRAGSSASAAPKRTRAASTKSA